MLKTILFLFFSLTLFQSIAQSDHQTISVQTNNNNNNNNNNIYKYFQIDVNTGLNLVGKIMLNGVKVHDFNKEMTQLSRNLKRKQLEDGENKLVLIVTKIPKEIKKGYFDDALITMTFHATNEKVFPSKETELFKILWDPKPEQTETVIEYLFELNL